MFNHSSFKHLLTHTISNPPVHFFLILLEYICFIFPSSFNATIKIQFYGYSTSVISTSTLNVNVLFPIKYIHETNSIIFKIVLFSIVIFFLLFYYVFLLFGIPNHKIWRIPLAVVINSIDIFLFRYLSLFPIDFFIWFFIDFYQIHNLLLNICSVLLLILFFIYLYTAYYYINRTTVLLNIFNPLLVNKITRYPYDNLSSNYQICFLFIKAFIAVEYNYYRTIQTINSVIVSLNICILLLSLSLFFSFSIVNIYINFSCTVFYANFELNYFRNAISIFNCVVSILCLSIDNDNYIVILIIGANLTLLIIFYEYKSLFNYLLKTQVISYEVVLLLMIHNNDRSSFIDYTKIINSCYIKYLDKSIHEKCICKIYEVKDVKSSIKIFYKYLKGRNSKKEQSIYEEITKVLYYKMKGKSIRLLRLYYNLLRKYKGKNELIVQTLKIVVKDWLIKDTDDNTHNIESLIKVKGLEVKTKNLLNDLMQFFNENVRTKQPETVIKISNDIHDTITEFKKVTSDYMKMDETSTQLNENSKKTINDILTYTTNILRFIIQTLTNQGIKGLPATNIENLDDFLYVHFTVDHLLISSLDLKNAQFNKEIFLVKITGELGRYSHDKIYLRDYFPNEIAQEGIEEFNRQIYTLKANERVFVFPFQIKCVVSYIKYTFRLIQTLQTSRIVFFGEYIKEKKKCTLLDVQASNSVKILSFCIDFLTLIQFRRKWILYLKASKYDLYLHSIFKTVKVSNDKSQIDCEFNYDYFLNKSSPLFYALRGSTEFKSNPKNEEQLISCIDTLQRYSGYCLVLSLEIVTKYSNEVALYTSTLKTKHHASILIKGINGKTKVNDDNNTNEFQLNFQANTFQSSSNTKRTTRLSSSLLYNNKMTQYQMLNSSLKLKIEKKTKRLALFSMIMICFNIILIVICFVFLVTQVIKSTNLAVLCELFFQLKSMRLCFTNFINTLSASSCYKINPNDVGCINMYNQYSNYFTMKYQLDPQFSLVSYISEELSHKAIYTQIVLSKIKEFLYKYRKLSFGLLLEEQMDYFEFDHSSSGIKMMKKKITFEEGLREYLNTMFILSQPDSRYEKVPLVYISYINGEYNFDLIPNKKLSDTQKYLYKGLINYMNFYYSFDNGEEDILHNIDTLKSQNKKMNLTFMISLAVLNGLLGVFCFFNIITAYHLFKILIINIINQLEKKEVLNMLIRKIDHLATLVKLYDKNPNDLIKTILTDQEDILDTSENTSKKIKEKNISFVGHASFGSQFFRSLVGKVLYVLLLIFCIFFIVIFAFDCFISQNYAKLFKVFNYTSLYYSLEDGIYSNIAFTALTHFCNISNEDFADLIGKNNPRDGILNDLIRKSLDDVQSLAVYPFSNSKKNNLIQGFYNYTCDGIFYNFEDKFIKTVSDLHGMDYRIVSQTVCNAFDSLILDNFFFLQSDMVDRTQKLANKITGRSYKDIAAFDKSYDLYELFTISIFIFRPISFYYRSTVLLPEISYNFTGYVELIAIYLGVNIFLEILLFIIVKWVIIKRLDDIRDNLYLFNNCVN